MEEQIIKWIAQRIKDEHRKHAKNIDNWEQIAARKIVATYNVTLCQPDVIKSVCDHLHTSGSFFGGDKYIVKCKDCDIEL